MAKDRTNTRRVVERSEKYVPTLTLRQQNKDKNLTINTKQ